MKQKPKRFRQLLLAFSLLLPGIILQGQQRDVIGEVRVQYRAFNYEEVISLSNKILTDSLNISEKELIDLYTMQAVAFYSLNKPDSATSSFNNLLGISEDHKLNPGEISPKIIEFFEEVRAKYQSPSKPIQEKKPEMEDSSQVKDIVLYSQKTNTFRNSAIRSMVFPGWGHLYAGENLKGWTFSALNVLNLGAMVFFIIDTNDKEQKYLAETEKQLIQDRFEDYNQSYRLRNISIITYAMLWLYTQLDLLFLSDIFESTNLNPVLNSQISPRNGENFTLSFKYFF